MKQLLILIDLQQGWRHQATEPAMLRAVELAKRFRGDVIHCCFQNQPASLFSKQLNWQRMARSPDIDQIPEVSSLQLPQYWRGTYSCLTEPVANLIHDYTTVYLAGVFTDISIAATAMAIFDQAIPVNVVADCVATLHGEPVHQAGLRSLEHAIGRHHVIASAEIS